MDIPETRADGDDNKEKNGGNFNLDNFRLVYTVRVWYVLYISLKTIFQVKYYTPPFKMWKFIS